MSRSRVLCTPDQQLVKAYDKLLTQYNRDMGFELTLVRTTQALSD